MDIKIIPPRKHFFSLPEIFFRIYSYCGKFSKSDFDSKTILNPPQLLKTFSFSQAMIRANAQSSKGQMPYSRKYRYAYGTLSLSASFSIRFLT